MPLDPPPTRVSPPPKPESKVEIRDASWSDARRMAELAQRAYWDTRLSDLLSPLRATYPEDNLEGYTRRIKARMLSPRNRGFVALGDGEIVGYMQCVRLGDDDGAAEVQREKKTWWSGLAEWAYGLCGKGLRWMWPDRSESAEGLAFFMKAGETEDARYWKDREDRSNRWYVQSVVVAEEWRGRGVGKKLMAPVLEKAQMEGVVVGLEASELGEGLYLSVGFKLLGRFSLAIEEDDANHGGIMMWSPKRGGGIEVE